MLLEGRGGGERVSLVVWGVFEGGFWRGEGDDRG